MKKIDNLGKGTSIDEINMLLHSEFGMNFGVKPPDIKFKETVDSLSIGLTGQELKNLMDNPEEPSLEEQAEIASFNAYLEIFHGGKWLKHLGTFDSIQWNDGYDPPDESHSLPYSCLLYTSPSPRDS